VLKSRESNDKGALRSIVDTHNRDAKDPIRYTEESMYDDIKKHIAKVRKAKHTNHSNHTNQNYSQHQSNQNSQSSSNTQNNQHHSNAPNHNRSYKGARSNEPEKVQSSYSAPVEQNNINNLMGHYGFNPYGQMPNVAQQMQLQMQMHMMTMGNHQNGRCENYPTFIRKAVESSDEEQ
jgi:hypothetical protein